MVMMAPYTNMPDDVKKLAMDTEAAITDGKLQPFKCPVVGQDGKDSRMQGRHPSRRRPGARHELLRQRHRRQNPREVRAAGTSATTTVRAETPGLFCFFLLPLWEKVDRSREARLRPMRGPSPRMETPHRLRVPRRHLLHKGRREQAVLLASYLTPHAPCAQRRCGGASGLATSRPGIAPSVTDPTAADHHAVGAVRAAQHQGGQRIAVAGEAQLVEPEQRQIGRLPDRDLAEVGPADAARPSPCVRPAQRVAWLTRPTP